MPSNYPTGLDALATNLADATTMATTHKDHHNNLADAVNKIEAELGTNPKGTYADVAARLNGGSRSFFGARIWSLGDSITIATAATRPPATRSTATATGRRGPK
jgi:superoxide dismutase